MIELTEEEILADELAEQENYKNQKEMNNSLLPCPKCGSKVEIDFCVWECCKGQPRYIECEKCEIFASTDIEEWNNRTAKLYTYPCGNGEEIV